jgi:hypothetical protein
VPGATLNRLWPQTPDKVRKTIAGSARSQAALGFVFFAVSHAMLGAAFYLSETRVSREPEADQTSAIRPCSGARPPGCRRGRAHRDNGDTPLIRAADMGNVELVKVFLAAKADVQSTTGDDATALTEAIRGGHEGVVGLLRAAGSDVAATPVERPGR